MREILHQVSSCASADLAYNDLALLAMRRFQHTDAITLLNHAIEAEVELEMRYSDHHPDHRFYINRGDCFMALGRTELATADFSIAHASAPLDSTVTTRISMMHYNLAIPLFNGGDFSSAETELSVAIKYSPKIAQYYACRGEAAYYQHKFDSACLDFRLALRNGGQQAALVGRSHFSGRGTEEDRVYL